ncbi:hypothetical protein Hokovirus_3_236 [Hokovirus HKV1]|uniref:Uncharacterized protein n=1 Tax=Hokovirus HKV1 TaxID=1977638 RepID=A0A1V0SGY1_9VIRU|nr:hypothetical protein Hokovirus_3_236 [Hokovirus HKV1]
MKLFIFTFIKKHNSYGYVPIILNEKQMDMYWNNDNIFLNNVNGKLYLLTEEQILEYKKLLNKFDTKKIKDDYLVNMYLPFKYNNNIYFVKRIYLENYFIKNIF